MRNAVFRKTPPSWWLPSASVLGIMHSSPGRRDRLYRLVVVLATVQFVAGTDTGVRRGVRSCTDLGGLAFGLLPRGRALPALPAAGHRVPGGLCRARPRGRCRHPAGSMQCRGGRATGGVVRLRPGAARRSGPLGRHPGRRPRQLAGRGLQCAGCNGEYSGSRILLELGPELLPGCSDHPQLDLGRRGLSTHERRPAARHWRPGGLLLTPAPAPAARSTDPGGTWQDGGQGHRWSSRPVAVWRPEESRTSAAVSSPPAGCRVTTSPCPRISGATRRYWNVDGTAGAGAGSG